jgi:hypothetical protein
MHQYYIQGATHVLFRQCKDICTQVSTLEAQTVAYRLSLPLGIVSIAAIKPCNSVLLGRSVAPSDSLMQPGYKTGDVRRASF